MLFLCGAAEMKCLDIGGWAGQRSGAQYEYNNEERERENKIIISCQSHIETVKVSPGNSQTAASALDTRERQKQRQR